MSQKVVFANNCSDNLVTQYSMTFDGVNENIIGQANGIYNFEKTDSFSFALKVKPTSNGSQQSFFLKYVNAFPYRGYGLNYLTDGSIRFFMICGSVINGEFIDIRTAINTLIFNSWNHIVLTYDGSQNSSGVKLYVNNTLINWTTIAFDDVSAGTSIQNAGNLEIGGGSGFLYSGIMKDVRIWNLSLSSENVTTEYNNMSNHNIKPILIGNLIGHCTMGTDDNAIWALDTWAFKDLSNSGLNFRGVNLEEADRTNDIP